MDLNLDLTLALTLRSTFFRAQVQLREAVAVFKERQRRAEEEERRRTEQEDARRRREAVGIEAELRKRREKVCTALRIVGILAEFHCQQSFVQRCPLCPFVIVSNSDSVGGPVRSAK